MGNPFKFPKMHIGRDFNKFSTNIGQGLGSFITSVITNPLGDLTGSASDFLNSPIMYLGIAVVGVIIVSTIAGGTSVGGKVASNDEFMTAIARKI